MYPGTAHEGRLADVVRARRLTTGQAVLIQDTETGTTDCKLPHSGSD